MGDGRGRSKTKVLPCIPLHETSTQSNITFIRFENETTDAPVHSALQVLL